MPTGVIVSGIRNSDPEEPPPRDLLDRQQREPEPEPELEGDPAEDEDHGHDQRPRPAAVARQRLDGEPDEADEQDPGEQPEDEPERPVPAAPDGLRPGPAGQHDRDAEDRPADRVGRLHHAEEVRLLEAEQELLVVREPDEREVDAARAEDELRDRQRDRGDEREERQREDEEDRRPDEEPAGGAVRAPGAEAVGRSGAGQPNAEPGRSRGPAPEEEERWRYFLMPRLAT